MKKDIKTIVEDLLRDDIRCRNDDKWLTYRVFEIIAKKHGQGIFIPFNLFNEFPAFETIKRTRAKIQNEEKRYLPILPIQLKREKEIKKESPIGSIYRNSHLT